MTAMEEDSFTVPSLGKQFDSAKPTRPAFSFGTGQRDTARLKIYTSSKHEKCKCIITSPGPVYSVPTTVGVAPCYGFGSDEQRKHPKAKFPDSSVDLTGATVDSQKVKFDSTAGVHFGTEARLACKNAEIIRTNPALALGAESPGALEYTPDENKIREVAARYSFGRKTNQKELNEPKKPCTRLSLPRTSTPRHVGPGSHNQTIAMGQQPQSARSTNPSWSFGTEEQRKDLGSKQKQLIDTAPEFSSLGKQVVSNAKSAPRCGFGTSTREHSARTHLVTCPQDAGPTARMPKPTFHCDLPRPAFVELPKPGM